MKKLVPLAKKPLRIGLLIDSMVQPQWVYKTIELITYSSVAAVVLIIKNDSSPQNTAPSHLHWLRSKRGTLLWEFYCLLDDLVFRSTPDPLKPMTIDVLLKDCPIISVQPLRKNCADFFTEEDISAIRHQNLDVAFQFGFRILRGNALSIAKYGVWSYHHGDNSVNMGGPAGFWEVMQDEPLTGSTLQILTPDHDNRTALYQSWSSTFKFSVRKNISNVYWKSTQFAMRKLQGLYESPLAALGDRQTREVYLPYSYPLYELPSNAQMLKFLAKISTRILAKATQQVLSRDQWCLAFKINESTAPANTFYDFKLIIPPKDRLWADPFPEKKMDKYFIFIEEYVYKEKKGHISFMEIDQTGSWTRPIKVLEKNYHLSYPCLFSWHGNYYMIPETYDNKTLELYRCVSFPDSWELETILMDKVNAVDATLIEIDKTWWMFVNMAVDGSAPHDELYLFYADTPFGPWKAHKRNPVKSDVRCARPAGRPFHWRGNVYRPAQDCSVRYGYAISLNKINRLTGDDFEEELVSRIMPAWKPKIAGVHTINHSGELTIIDAFMYRRRFP
jgi:hypothetical protein